jgi:dTDP-4-dehydrorhamnose reductase
MTPCVLLLGGSGLVGSTLLRAWADELVVDAPSHADLDVLDDDRLTRHVATNPAEVIVNAAAWADVDGAEPESERLEGRVYQLNAAYPKRLAELCGESGKYLVHISTDYVFDGTSAERPYTEIDAPRALCWYAETKLRGEQFVLASGASAAVARIEMPFTARPHVAKRDLARTLVARLEAGKAVQGVVDQHITPVLLEDAAKALRALVVMGYTGLIHVASTTWTSPYEFARAIALRLRLDPELIQPTTFEQFAATRPARRPKDSWLDVSRFVAGMGNGILRSVDEQLEVWARQRELVRSERRGASGSDTGRS